MTVDYKYIIKMKKFKDILSRKTMELELALVSSGTFAILGEVDLWSRFFDNKISDVKSSRHILQAKTEVRIIY